MPNKIPPPVIVSFTVTRQCNLRCKHCYTDAMDSPHPEELSTAEAKRVIEEIAALGSLFLIFDGGEPLLRPDIYELISWARGKGLHPLVGSNATLLSTEAVDKLKKAGTKMVAISLDSAEASSHDEFRGFEGSWERAVAGIHNAVSADIPVQIDHSLHRGNLREFEDIAREASQEGASAVEVFDFVPAGRGKRHPGLELTPEERRDMAKKIIQQQQHDKEMVYRCIAIPQFWVEVEKIVNQEDISRFVRTCCGAGIRYCSIFYEGTVYPCVLLQKGAGNIRDNSFTEIWYNSDVFHILRNRDKLGGKCGRCYYREVCGGARCRVFEKTGSLTRADETCWFKEEELRGGS